MAKKWAEVAASPEFNALEPQQQEEARQQYWREVVAPNVPQEQLQAVQSEFDADTKPTIANPDAKPLDVEITGGQSIPSSDYAKMRQQEGAQVPVASHSLGQEFGLGARTLLQGAGGLLGAVGGDALNHYVINPALRAVGLGDQQALPYRDEAAGLADKLGLPKPQGAQQRVLNDVGEALTGTGLTMGLGSLLSGGATAAPSAASKLGDLLSGQPVRQVIGTVGGATGSSVARELGADEKTQMLAGLAGGLGPDLLGAGGAASVRGLVRGRNGDAMSQTIKDFESVGATPSVGQASGNRAIQGVESLLSGAPTSTGVMSRFAEKQAEDIGAGLGKTANNLSQNASAERAGRAIERGVDQFRGNSRAQQKALYWQADRFIPDNTPVSVGQTWQELMRLTTPTPGATATTGAMVNPRIAQLRENLAKDVQDGAARDIFSDDSGAPVRLFHGGARNFDPANTGGRPVFVRQGRPSGYGESQHELNLHGRVLELPQMRELLRTSQGEMMLRQKLGHIDDDTLDEVIEALTDGSNYPDSPKVQAAIGAIDEADAQLEIQSLRGFLARKMGFHAVRTPDEFDGDTLMVIRGEGLSRAGSGSPTGNIPYSALRAIRTQVGEQISDFSMTPDVPTRQLKQLYGALSRDMNAAAKAAGPQAEQAAKRANNYTLFLNNRFDAIQHVIDKNGGPEAIYSAAMSGTRDGGTTLRKVMQSLPPDGQKAVTAAVIKRMGMATPGAQDAAGDVFSAATFMTNWNRVSPEAKRALFDRYGPSFSKNMDQIARVANNIKQGSRVYANPSGTANKAAAYTYGASLVASMFDPTLISTGGLIGGGLAANGAARYLTDPRAVRWLAKATEMPRHALVVNARMLAQSANKAGDENMMQLAQDVENAIGNSGPAEDNGRNK